MTSSTTTATPTTSEHDGGKDKSEDDNPPRHRPRLSLASSITSINSVDWREKTNMSVSERFPQSSTRQRAEVDDEEGKAQFFLILLFQRYVRCYMLCLSWALCHTYQQITCTHLTNFASYHTYLLLALKTRLPSSSERYFSLSFGQSSVPLVHRN